VLAAARRTRRSGSRLAARRISDRRIKAVRQESINVPFYFPEIPRVPERLKYDQTATVLAGAENGGVPVSVAVP